jgi:RNA polymerase-binding transcription factor DksA
MTQTTTGNNLADANGEQMRKAFLKKIKSMLETQKNEIEKRIESNIRGGEIDDNGDDTDLVQARILALAAKQLADRDQLNIKKIAGALQRINENRYGICATCEEEIEENRLIAIPSICQCISCSEKAEIMKKRGC